MLYRHSTQGRPTVCLELTAPQDLPDPECSADTFRQSLTEDVFYSRSTHTSSALDVSMRLHYKIDNNFRVS